MDFQKEGKAKERRRTEVLTGNGDEVEEEEVSGEEEREPECDITAGVSAVNASQSLKQSNITDYSK